MNSSFWPICRRRRRNSLISQQAEAKLWECTRKAAAFGSFNLHRAGRQKLPALKGWECNALECFLYMINSIYPSVLHSPSSAHTPPPHTSICVKLLFAIRPLATSQIRARRCEILFYGCFSCCHWAGLLFCLRAPFKGRRLFSIVPALFQLCQLREKLFIFHIEFILETRCIFLSN